MLVDRRRSLGPTHPHVAWTLTNLARAVAESGNPALGLRYLSDAAAIYEKSGAADEPDHFARLLELRRCSLRGPPGNYAAARKSVVAALTERERIFQAPLFTGSPLKFALDFADIDFALSAVEPALRGALASEDASRTSVQFTIRHLPGTTGDRVRRTASRCA